MYYLSVGDIDSTRWQALQKEKMKTQKASTAQYKKKSKTQSANVHIPYFLIVFIITIIS